MPFGFFARIPKFQIDGLVHMSSLPGRYYRREEGGLSLVGEGDKNRYRLNDRLKVIKHAHSCQMKYGIYKLQITKGEFHAYKVNIRLH